MTNQMDNQNFQKNVYEMKPQIEFISEKSVKKSEPENTMSVEKTELIESKSGQCTPETQISKMTIGDNADDKAIHEEVSLLANDSQTITEYISEDNGKIVIKKLETIPILERADHFSEITTESPKLKNKIMVVKQYFAYDNPNTGERTFYQQQRVGDRSIWYEVGPPPPVNTARSPAYQIGDNDPSNSPTARAFFDIKIRNRFILKVYSILLLQLLFTFGFICLCVFEPHTRRFILAHLFIVYIALGVFLVSTLLIYCFQGIRRTFPCNLLMLSIFTMSLAYIWAVVSTFYETYIVVGSMGIALIACLIITLFAIQTSIDVTQCGACLAILTILVMVYGLIISIVAIFTYEKIMFMVYSGLIGFLFTIYLIYDTQQIIGGRSIEISPEEYIVGALQLYLDTMYIFYAILRIWGGSE